MAAHAFSLHCTPSRVYPLGHYFHMLGVHTSRVLAQVVDYHVRGYSGGVEELVKIPVRPEFPAIHQKHTIPVRGGFIASPLPTAVRLYFVSLV